MRGLKSITYQFLCDNCGITLTTRTAQKKRCIEILTIPLINKASNPHRDILMIRKSRLNTFLLSSREIVSSSNLQKKGMSVPSLEREMELMGITARERVLGDPDMLDIVFSYLDHRSVKRVRLVST